LRRGDRVARSAGLGGLGVAVAVGGTGVIVGVPVGVEAGKISVIAGSGMSVVVGVFDGVRVGVSVAEGVLCVGVEVVAAWTPLPSAIVNKKNIIK